MLDVHEMHRAAKAPAEPVLPTHQLGHHPTQRRALGDGVAMGAVVAVHRVVRAQLAAHADRHTLLADAEVHETVHLVRTRQLADALLEGADAPHRAQELEADVAVEPSRSCAHLRCDRAAERLLHRGDDLRLVGQQVLLHRLAVGDRRVESRHQLDGRL